MRCSRWRALLLTVGLLLAGSASADRDKAKEEYREAVQHYDLNEFQVALEHFKKAYLEYEEPTLLFNIAQCFRQLGDKQQAILFYRSYLRKLPDAPNGDEVKQLIANLEASAKSESAAAPPPAAPAKLAGSAATTPSASSPPIETHAAVASTPPAAPDRRAPLYRKWWLWTAVGVVIAGAAVGITLGVQSAAHSEASFMTVRVSP